MEQLSVNAVSVDASPAKETSLTLAIALSLASLSFAFVQVWVGHFGLQTLPEVGRAAFSHPQAISELVAEAVGGSLLFPLLHVAIASLFKSKRNPSSRRRIFIGWSLFIIIVSLLRLWTKSKGY